MTPTDDDLVWCMSFRWCPWRSNCGRNVENMKRAPAVRIYSSYERPAGQPCPGFRGILEGERILSTKITDPHLFETNSHEEE